MTDGVKMSAWPLATEVTEADVLVGLQSAANKRFRLLTLLNWIKNLISPADIGAVPDTRTINGKALTSNITLDAADVGAQGSILVSGILKGDGNGGVSAAAAGTDYQAPLTFDSTPIEDSNNPVTSGGVYSAIRVRNPQVTLFNTLTDVHTDTTVTMADDFTNYKFLGVVFNSRSPAASARRIVLLLSTNLIPQGGFYPIMNDEVSGYVRINYVSGQNKQIRFQATNISTLYLTNILGIY